MHCVLVVLAGRSGLFCTAALLWDCMYMYCLFVCLSVCLERKPSLPPSSFSLLYRQCHQIELVPSVPSSRVGIKSTVHDNPRRLLLLPARAAFWDTDCLRGARMYLCVRRCWRYGIAWFGELWGLGVLILIYVCVCVVTGWLDGWFLPRVVLWSAVGGLGCDFALISTRW